MAISLWIPLSFYAALAILNLDARVQEPVSMKAPLSVREEGPGPSSGKVIEMLIRSGGCHIAYVVERNGKVHVFANGKDGAEYDSIKRNTLMISDDGERLAYVARIGKKFSLIVDGNKGAEYDDIDFPVFSSNSRRLAYIAQKGTQSVAVVDGIEGKGYFQIIPQSLGFSPDSRRVAFVARPASPLSNPQGHWALVVDGQEGSKHHFVIGPYFSPDRARVAYVAISDTSTAFGKSWGGGMSVHVDGKNGPEYDEVGLGSFGSLLRQSGMTPPVFSPDGKRMAYIARKGRTWSVIADGVQKSEYDQADSIVFSPDGGHLAYLAKRGPKWSVIVDGKEGPEYDHAGGIIFSSEGGHLAYAAQQDAKWSVIVDGKQGPEYDDIGSPAFRRDGKRLVYRARKGERNFVVMGDQEGVAYDEIKDPALSPDGMRIAFQARKGPKWIMVVDGREGQEFDEIVGNGCTFRPDGTIEYLAVKDKDLYRIKL